MPRRQLTIALILAVAFAGVLLSTAYGPSRRTYASPPRTTPVASVAGAYDLWVSLGIRGRVGIVFSPDLVPAAYGLTEAERSAVAPGIDAIDRAMHHGVIREIIHVIPDDRWRIMALGLSHITIYRPTSTGLVAAFENGRVYVLPLSRLWGQSETALVLLDAGAWSREELGAIARRLGSGFIRSDLVAVVNGSASDLELLSAAQRSAGR